MFKLVISNAILPTGDPRFTLRTLHDAGLSGDVEVGWSAVNGTGEVRHTITIFSDTREDLRKLFDVFCELQRKYELTCAWLEDSHAWVGPYAGCILKHRWVPYAGCILKHPEWLGYIRNYGIYKEAADASYWEDQGYDRAPQFDFYGWDVVRIDPREDPEDFDEYDRAGEGCDRPGTQFLREQLKLREYGRARQADLRDRR